MKIIVLGKNGMLGRYVYTYLKSDFNVVGTTRETLVTDDDSLYDLDIYSGDVIINCIGAIPQRLNTDPRDFYITNTEFPLRLQEFCNSKGAKLIHPSTDCVYDGAVGNYSEQSEHTATDVYGKSKSLGEPFEATVIRTSIVGEEIVNGLSLLAWVQSNKNKQIKGFTNHFWNGITCLQFAIICEEIIKNNMFWQGVKHIHSPTSVSKYELVKMISKVYDLNIDVLPVETPELCNKTLTSIKNSVSFKVPELEVQLEAQREFFINN